MFSDTDLKIWLDRNNEYYDNLLGCIQIWNSKEYISVKKYSIILEYLCDKLSDIVSGINIKNRQKFWGLIQKVLNLEYPKTTSIPYNIIQRLINSFIAEAIKAENNKFFINQCFLIILGQAGFRKFYEKHVVDYCELLNFTLNYFLKYVDTGIAKQTFGNKVSILESATSIQESIITFFKYLKNNAVTQKQLVQITTKTNLQLLSELIITLKHLEIDASERYFEILHEFYFTAEDLERFSLFFKRKSKKDISIDIFKFPVYTQLFLIEGFFNSYKLKKIEIFEMIKYIIRESNTFEDKSGNLGEEENIRNNLICVEYFFNLLDKYAIKIDNFNDTELLNQVSTYVTKLAETHHEKFPIEVMNIVIIILKYNSHILKSNIWKIFTEIMLLDKQNNPKLMEKYNELIVQLISTTIKLNTFQSFPINFKREFKDNNKLPKSLKRKAGDDIVNDNDLELNEKKSNIFIENPEENWNRAKAKDYLYMLCNYENVIKRSKGSNITVSYDRLITFDNISSWSAVNFAWPPNTPADTYFQNSIQQSLTFKQQLIFWNIISKSLEEELTLKSSINEESFFLINLYTLLSCQFLASNILIENSKLMFIAIMDKLAEYYQLLQKFGKLILNRKHNQYMINSFLNLSYYYYNFGLAFYNYCPDSINTEAENEYKLETSVDVNTSIRNMDKFLTQDEWTLIEQRVVNFGEIECKKNMQRLNLNRIKISAFLNEPNFSLSQFLIDTKLVEAILLDETLNTWFIKSIDRSEMAFVSNVIVQNDNIIKSTKHLFENMEFLEVLTLSILKHLCKNNLFNSKYTISTAINFENILNLDVEILQYLKQNILSSVNDKKFTNYDKDELLRILNILTELPLGYLSVEVKDFILGPLLGLTVDIIQTDDDAIIQVILSILTNLIEIDGSPNLFQLYSIEVYLKIFSNTEKNKSLYQSIFRSSGKNGLTRTEFDNYLNLLKLFKLHQTEFYFNICTILSESLFKVYDNNIKEFPLEEFNSFKLNLCHLLCNYMKNNFESSPEYMEKTINAVCCIIHNQIKGKIIDDEMNTFCNTYLVDYLNYALKLPNSFNIIVSVLKLPQYATLGDDLKENCSNFIWSYFRTKVLEDIENRNEIYNSKRINESYDNMEEFEKESSLQYKEMTEHHSFNSSDISLEDIAKSFIFSCELLKVNCFKKMNDRLVPKKLNIQYQFRCVELFMNCKKIDFAVGKRLIKIYTSIYTEVILPTFIEKKFLENIPQLLQILRTTTLMIKSQKQIPLQMSQIDEFLNLLIEINLRKYQVTTENFHLFVELHKEMAEMLFTFIKKRSDIAVKRIPILFIVFEDLLESIVLYKSDTDGIEKLIKNEINILTVLGHKLEKILNVLVTNHSKHLPLLAPSLLSFVITLLTTKKQKTTLFEKVKNVTKNICFAMMKVLNEHTEKNLLLTHNEAFKEVFKGLSVEYRRYHAFRGKV